METPEAEITTELDDVAVELTGALVGAPPMMLGEPLSLTIKKKDGGYSKRPHIGGENFRPVRAYAGKRGKLIFVFTPVEVTDYLEMEMDEAQAKKALVGFGDHLHRCGGSDLLRRKKEAQNVASMDAEREVMGSRKEYEELGFGSW